uniref:Uncharacterized protein n=1 Tax=Arundo donax TaxID=35708 RepID=A0A0A9HS38_ARUDO
MFSSCAMWAMSQISTLIIICNRHHDVFLIGIQHLATLSYNIAQFNTEEHYIGMCHVILEKAVYLAINHCYDSP